MRVNTLFFTMVLFLSTNLMAQNIQNSPKEEHTPVYDESADAKMDIVSALIKAKKENKRVLIQWGANWCGWCIKLHDLYEKDKKIARKLLYEYEVVFVDLGRFKKI